MTQSRHVARDRSALDKERYVGAEIDGFSLGGERRFAALTLIHSVHNHTDDDSDYGTTHTTANQLTGDRC